MSTVYVYALSDPRTGEPRYIGKTDNLARRFAQHQMPCRLKRRSRKNGWLKSLLAQDLAPTMAVLEQWPSHALAARAEERLIAEYRTAGHDLLNLTDGGDGAKGYRPTAAHRAAIKAWHTTHKAEHRAKVSAKKKEEWADPDKRQKMADSLERWRSDPEVQARMRERRAAALSGADAHDRRVQAMRRALQDPAALAKKRATWQAVLARPDVKAKIAEATRQRWADPAYKARRSANMKGRTISQATREAVARSNRTRVVSEETRKKMSERMKRLHAQRRAERALAAASVEVGESAAEQIPMWG